ncbi:hypothetical protein ABT187_45570 [Streptomyces sp. NPDC001817]|uniref:hypothetical protein n=1 Tax=Streptomyces sp. NPDC001817 TaxID=3154398 RepID=UPI00331AAFBA
MAGTPDDRDFSGLSEQGGEADQALQSVRAVLTWYTSQIAAERRAPLPDEERIEQLTTARETVHEDLDRLREASTEERARLAEVYAARLRELES